LTIYLRVADPKSFDAYEELLVEWSNDGFETKFNLYSSMKDAILGTNPWRYCNGGDRNVGFPRDCAPTKDKVRGGQWNGIKHSGSVKSYKFSVWRLDPTGSAPF